MIPINLTPEQQQANRARLIAAGFGELKQQINAAVGRFVTNTEAGKAVVRKARHYAGLTYPVLITGESGTGKELVARILHGDRSYETFKAFNCAGFVDTLFESELFGYAPGSFTGGLRDGKVGLIEAAGNGTLFLDEIGEMPLSQQAKLLRVLQEKEFTRVGSTSPIKATCRWVFATNRDLASEVLAGRFRKDLFYRIHQLLIHVPSLRERKDDVHLIARAVAQNLGLSTHDVPAEIPEEWYLDGNVRQLEGNLIRHITG